MIAKLTGRLDTAGPDAVVIDVGGVGYLVQCPTRTLAALGSPGSPVSLAIDTQMRDDRIQLFGFADALEREWFRHLMTVQGVGARVALAILGVLTVEGLVAALVSQDRAALARADGVGPKLAGRIVAELRERAGAAALDTASGRVAALPSASSSAGPVAAAAAGAAAGDGDPTARAHDAVSALVNLGYGRSEAFGAVTEAGRRLGAAAALADLIRDGLRTLGARGEERS